MPLWQAVVLAVAQGITEFLPISSTAHLTLIPWLFGWQDPGLTFDVALHVGTLFAVSVYFFRTWVDLLVLGVGRNPIYAKPPVALEDAAAKRFPPHRTLFWFLVVATFPAGIAGWMFHEQVATTLRHPAVVGSALILMAIPMAWGDKVGRSVKTLYTVSLADSLWIGFSQALALVPGVSRSGATISMGRFLGYEREAATRYAFLLAIPAVVGAGLYELQEIPHGSNAYGWGPTIVATVVSFVVGYAAIAWLLRYISTHSYTPFVLYRVALGTATLVLVGAGVLSA